MYQKRLSVGTYPEISLKVARERRDAIRSQVAQGIDPSAERQALKEAQVAQESTLEIVAREWFIKHRHNWAVSHGETILRRLERDIFPVLGAQPIENIDAMTALKDLYSTEQKGTFIQRVAFFLLRRPIASGRLDTHHPARGISTGVTSPRAWGSLDILPHPKG
jgi:hypothetical protein